MVFMIGKKGFILLTLLIILIFSAPLNAAEQKSTILTAERISEPISIDGLSNEHSWGTARELVTLVKDGSIGKVDVSIKALYDEENIYLFVSWKDPTESVTKDIWTYDGGEWRSSEDEDRLSFFWNVGGSINAFDIAGCAMLCHGDRMHTNAPGEKGDLWHWKASRSNPLGMFDDEWIDHTIVESYDYISREAAFHPDFGGEIATENVDGSRASPEYYEPSSVDQEDTEHLFQEEIENGEAVKVNGANILAGATAPGYILHRPSGSRGDIEARGVWMDGRWNVEFKRKLKTGNEDDVQFDTAHTYRFGIAIMDNTGGFEAFGKGHSFDLGARTLEFGGRGSKEVTELALVRDYLVSAKAYTNRGESGLALSTISDSLAVFNRIRDPVADLDPDLFIKIRNGFVDSRRIPSPENIDTLINNVDLAMLTFQGKRSPPEATLGLRILVFWGKFGVYAFVTLAFLAFLALLRMLRIIKKTEFRYLGIFMVLVISPIFFEGAGRLGALLKVPFLQNLSFTTSEYITLAWALGMFIALYIGRIGFNEIDDTLKSLEYYGRELESKMEELRKSQEQLLKSERLASIGQLAASMAHELRNPLGVIKNVNYYLGMALSDADEKIKKHLKILGNELNISNKIITDLLEFSSGKPPVLKRAELNPIIRSAISKAEMPENINTQIRLGRVLPDIMADKEQLQRVFFNIIINSVQAMHEGGNLKIISRKEEEKLIVTITDSGIGIPEEEMSKIFEPLFTTKAKGIGLGLVLSRQIVELHGGKIDVESLVGKGTTFTVVLPVKKK